LNVASVVTVGLLAAIGLTGCINAGSGFANAGSGFAVLDRAARPDDTLPTDLRDYAYEGLDPASSRFVGEHDGDRLYLANGDHSTICLVVYANGKDWFIGCSDDGSGTVSGPSRAYQVRPDAAPAPTRTQAISQNVYVVVD
jgi:hypothetical protein